MNLFWIAMHALCEKNVQQLLKDLMTDLTFGYPT